ncbi:MAG: hypothetical protein HYZ16_06225 [Bacteroidetes bacterium]|jgi:hypothetical protein|nr:hypothetical protein [Bacteroidota bacterium]
MKSFSLLLAAILILGSCSTTNPDSKCGRCTDMACTEEFAMIMVSIKDANGNPVILNEYTVSFAEGKKNKTQYEDAYLSNQGLYAIATDLDMDDILCAGTKISFEFNVDGKSPHRYVYTIGKDCCHVHFISGDSLEIIL